jgi:hypothetical protein
MDLAHANPAFKPAGMLVLILLLGRGVIHPAIGAGKIFNRPDAVSHRAIMRRIGRVFQPKRLPPSTTSYPDPRNHGLFGSAFLTSLRRKPKIGCLTGYPGERRSGRSGESWRAVDGVVRLALLPEELNSIFFRSLMSSESRGHPATAARKIRGRTSLQSDWHPHPRALKSASQAGR